MQKQYRQPVLKNYEKLGDPHVPILAGQSRLFWNKSRRKRRQIPCPNPLYFFLKSIVFRNENYEIRYRFKVKAIFLENISYLRQKLRNSRIT